MPTAIPYRGDTVLSAATLSPALIWTTVLLTVFVAALLLLKKKGMLARWQGGARISTTVGSIVKRAEYRVSRSTVVYLLEIEGESVLVTESRHQVGIQRLGAATEVSK
ncbi:hypothetical protein [Xanthomonas arboricola]|uniref:hypothetical protein n=1 Tax=Xanthomonas arboricola TaxID=56448 RepID=UPI000E1F90A4|nr:hypothetical protein [Xanthomonas arboricola]